MGYAALVRFQIFTYNNPGCSVCSQTCRFVCCRTDQAYDERRSGANDGDASPGQMPSAQLITHSLNTVFCRWRRLTRGTFAFLSPPLWPDRKESKRTAFIARWQSIRRSTAESAGLKFKFFSRPKAIFQTLFTENWTLFEAKISEQEKKNCLVFLEPPLTREIDRSYRASRVVRESEGNSKS